VQQIYDLKRMRSFDRLQESKERALLKRCSSAEELRREIYEINFANKDRKAQHRVKEEDLQRRKSWYADIVQDDKEHLHIVSSDRRK
jgi:hypothetical protein